jgi:hypothetical protein
MLKQRTFGRMSCIYNLTKGNEMRNENIQSIYQFLPERALNQLALITTFTNAHRQYQKSSFFSTQDLTDTKQGHTVDYHIVYIMETTSRITNEKSRRIRHHSEEHLPLYNVVNQKHTEFAIDRLIDAYHRPPNIGIQLPPWIQAEKGPTVSSY